MKQISSRDNPAYKSLKALIEDGREPRRQQRALLEGVHLVTAYRDKIGVPRCLVVSEQGMTQAEVRALLDSLPAVETWLLRDALFKTLSEMATPTGLLALIDLPESRAAADRRNRSCILLDAVQDAGNVGSILRSAAAAGIHEVFLGVGCAGVWTPRVLRAAQGAHFDLQLHEQADLSATLRGFNGLSVAATAHGEEGLFDQPLNGPVAWLLGSEGRGIRPELEMLATRRVTIPLATGSESLNVAAAAAICLFEEVRQRRRVQQNF
ncbi:MAG: RNA methyltransferase [Sterolibacterium sp.]|jgi:TrmH family RNA methyltransferase|nr:RNA methyltransferase [Sterolibacterium sp.]